MKQITSILFSTRDKISGLLRIETINGPLDTFESEKGAATYFRLIFKWLSIALLVWLLYHMIRNYMTYFSTGAHSGMEHVASIINLIICIYGAFTFTSLISKRGDSLPAVEKGMIHFIFNDLGKMAIRLTGELVVITLLFTAICSTVATLFNCTAFFWFNSGQATSSIYSFAGYLADLSSSVLNSALSMVNLNLDFGSLSLPTGSNPESVSGSWSSQSLYDLVMQFVGVLVSLVLVHIILNVYGYLVQTANTLIKWISNPSLPLSIKNK